jgi:hypothetical protein
MARRKTDQVVLLLIVLAAMSALAAKQVETETQR